MPSANLATVSCRLPRRVRDDFAARAERRRVTPSAFLRELIDRELAGGSEGSEVGGVEQAVRAELQAAGHEVSSGRAALALNLARRMDNDPVSGAANAGQLRLLLDELVPAGFDGFDLISWFQLFRQLRLRGYRLVDREGLPADVPRGERDEIISRVAGVIGRDYGGRFPEEDVDAV